MKYQTTLLEDWIKNFYYSLDIIHPHQLDLHDIANRLGLFVNYKDISSRFYLDEVILDKRLTEQEQWQDFGHELCHALRHEGNQLIMPKPFVELQEYQANLFAYHFCVPTFMLLKLDLPENNKEAKYYIGNMFNVTLGFAEKRLELYHKRLHGSYLIIKNY